MPQFLLKHCLKGLGHETKMGNSGSKEESLHWFFENDPLLSCRLCILHAVNAKKNMGQMIFIGVP